MTNTSSNDDVRRMIILDRGTDSELGIVGLGYSPDNGEHFFVTNTINGRVFRERDVNMLWPLLVDKIKSTMSLAWDDIQGKPMLVTKEELDQRLSSLNIPTTMPWSKITGKPNLALSSDIPSLDGYAKLTDIPSVTGLVKETELSDYVRKSDLPNFDNFVKQPEVDDIKATADSAESKAEQAQSTADANTKALQNVYTKEESDRKYWTADQEQNASNVKSVNNIEPDDQGNVDIGLTGYAKIDDIPKSMSWDNITGKPDLVTNDQLAYNMQHALATIDQAKTKIDTNDLHVIKKPSEYPDGFSYELKSMSALGIDRTNSHSTAQVGDMGLLITKAVSYDNTKYVRQTLEQLDNSRPLNYVRNGHDETWFSWEAVTSW